MRTTLLGELGRAEPERLVTAGIRRRGPVAATPCSTGGPRQAAVVNRDELRVGFELVGPAIIDEQTATTVVPPSWKVRVDEIGTLLLTPRGRGDLMGATAVDPITTEVIRNALNSAADEMNATLFRSAYTWIIYELRDCSVALLDSDHRVLGQSSGLPIFLGNLEVCTQLTEEMYGRDVWQPGDVWALNDSYLAGTHLNDISVYSPIFHEGELIGFGASRAHWLDVGAKDPGSPMDSTDIWQEGIRMGPTKVAEAAAFGRTSSTCLAGTRASPTRPAVT